MGRPLGSKNKFYEPEKTISPTVIVPQETICQRHNCKHSKKMHYGGENGHCNVQDCKCLEIV